MQDIGPTIEAMASYVVLDARESLGRLENQRMEIGLGDTISSADYSKQINNCFLTVQRAMTDFPDETKKEVLPYLGRPELGWRDFADQVLVLPSSSWTERSLAENNEFGYWGIDVELKGLPAEKGQYACTEVNFGIVVVFDDQKKPLGFVNIADEVAKGGEPRKIEAKIRPINDLFVSVCNRDYQLPTEEISAFLKDYSHLFSQDSEFARDSNLGAHVNLGAVPLEAKFAIWKYLKEGVSKEREAMLYEFLQVFQLPGTYMLKAGIERPASIEALVDLGCGTFQVYWQNYGGSEIFRGEAINDLLSDFQTYWQSSTHWLTGSERFTPEQIESAIAGLGQQLHIAGSASLQEAFSQIVSDKPDDERTKQIERKMQQIAEQKGISVERMTFANAPQPFLDAIETRQEAQRIMASDPLIMNIEALTWLAEVETYGLSIGETIARTWGARGQISSDRVQFIEDFSQALQTRTRELVCSLADYSFEVGADVLENGHWSDDKLRAVGKNFAFIRDALRSEITLTAVLASEGIDGLTDRLHLPPFFYQQYRDTYAGLPKAEVFHKAILELWQAVNVKREVEEGVTLTSSAPGILEIQSQSIKETSEGAQTAETATEIARTESIIKHVQGSAKQEDRLPNEISMLDCGCWDLRRLTKPEVEQMLPKYDIRVAKLIGVDACKEIIPNPYERADIRKLMIAQIGLQEDLIGKFDIVKGDWSAFSYAHSLVEQMAQVCSAAMAAKQNGLFIVDLPFIEGQGSYAKEIAEFRQENPNVTEGTMAWKWEEAPGEPQRFIFFHYEMLTDLLKEAGFQIENLPESREERIAYFDRVIAGKKDIDIQKQDAFASPVWRSCGKPRITLVARRRTLPQNTDNSVQKLILWLNNFPAVKEELKNAA